MADPTLDQLNNPYQEELMGLNRQRALANMLLQQNMQAPQGQMVSGRYVAPNPLQYLGNMAQIVSANQMASAADTEQKQIAKALRQQEVNDLTKFSELQYGTSDKMVQQAGPTPEGGNIPSQMVQGQAPNPMAAFQVAAQSQSPLLRSQLTEMLKGQKLAEGEIMQRYNPATGKMETTGKGNEKYHPPLQIDTGKNIEIRDPKDPTKVLQILPKTHVFAPHANQLVPVQGGFAEYNPNTKTLLPIGGNQSGAAGTPTNALMPPLPQHLQTEVASINQQKSSINDALKTVETNKDAFGPKFAAPGLLAGEYGTSRMNQKLTSSQVEARAKVFNIASSVIKERAGTAQSKQEQAIIMRFLPSPYDGEKAITDKFNAFNDYLTSKEKGMTSTIGAVPAYRPGGLTPTTTKNNGLPSGVTQAEWNAMPESDRKLFQ